MRDLDHAKNLLAHCAWADAMCFHAWGKGPGLEDTELRERMAHSVATQDFFLQTIQGEMDLPWDKILKGEVRPPWQGQPLKGYAELQTWASAVHARITAFAANLDAAELQREIRIPWFPDPPCVVGVGEAVVQLAMHTQHHRGQALARLRAIGGKPANVDYLIWIWKGRPVGRWE